MRYAIAALLLFSSIAVADEWVKAEGLNTWVGELCIGGYLFASVVTNSGVSLRQVHYGKGYAVRCDDE